MTARYPSTDRPADASMASAGAFAPDRLLLPQVIQTLAGDRLIIQEAPGLYAFRHSLTRDAVYGTLVRSERAALHLAVGEAVEQLFPKMLDPHLADLAYHFHEAGAWDKALDYGGRAAAKALAMYAPREAVQHCAQAIEAASRAGRTPPPGLYRTRGQAHELMGDFDLALADFERERESARSLGDARAEWQSLVDLGFLWAARDYGRTGEYFREALELARAADDAHTLGHTLNRLGNWYANIDQPRQALRYHREALDIFRGQNDRHGLAETLDLLGLTTFLSGDIIGGSDHFQEAIALFRELKDQPGLASALANHAERGWPYLTAIAVLPRVTIAQMIEEVREAVRVAQGIGWRSGEAYARLNLSFGLVSSGAYGSALEEADHGLGVASEIEHQQWLAYAHITLAALYIDLLAGNQARPHAERGLALAYEIGSLNFVRYACAGLVEACILQGQLSRAEFVLGAALGLPDLIASEFPDQAELEARGLVHSLSGRLCCHTLALLALARNKAETALEYSDLLLAVPPGAGPAGEGARGRLALLRARARIALGRAAEAETPLLTALSDMRERGALPLLWRLHAALGRVYQALGRNEQASQEWAQAAAIVGEIAQSVPEGALRENFLLKADQEVAR